MTCELFCHAAPATPQPKSPPHPHATYIFDGCNLQPLPQLYYIHVVPHLKLRISAFFLCHLLNQSKMDFLGQKIIAKKLHFVSLTMYCKHIASLNQNGFACTLQLHIAHRNLQPHITTCELRPHLRKSCFGNYLVVSKKFENFFIFCGFLRIYDL